MTIIERQPLTDTAAIVDNPTLFELQGVSVSVGSRVLLQAMDLNLSAGRIYGLVGHNGSGKSTLLKLLARQMTATHGTLSLAKQPLSQWSARSFAQQIAYLPQQPPAVDGMRVRELVALGRHPWHGALGRFDAQDHQHVEQAMIAADVAHYADRAVDSLSGGERQRAWMAMLVAQNCRCMLLDEPTSALDIGHQLALLELVRTLCRERGTGAVIILHDVNMAARFCDEVIALREGRLLLQVRADEILQQAHLQAIYGVPMGVFTDPLSGRSVSFPQ
jgi:ferric hydroxamate transport system ATP-binding protein